MRLHEAGTIDIDAPVHQYIDPWLYNQSCTEKSLLELWNGDTTINVVSARMLMNMRSGIADYNDAALLQWTIDNPANDFNPIDFVRNVSKKFRFLPDTGGLYSGVGYVMLGWLLASVTPAAATGWDKLDQSTLLGTALSDFHSTAIWMKDGSCSKYPGVTHQCTSFYSLSLSLSPPPLSLSLSQHSPQLHPFFLTRCLSPSVLLILLLRHGNCWTTAGVGTTLRDLRCASAMVSRHCYRCGHAGRKQDLYSRRCDGVLQQRGSHEGGALDLGTERPRRDVLFL